MTGPKIEEVDFYDLSLAIKKASDSGCLIEKSQKEKWNEFITENNIRAVSFEAHAKVKFLHGKPVLVGIKSGKSWDGCYAYSNKDEAALKYVP